MQDSYFNGRPFLTKEAAPLDLRKILFRRGFLGKAKDMVSPTTEGKFVRNVAQDTGLTPENSRYYTPDEIAQHRRKEIDDEGNGFIPDLAVGATNMLTPSSWGLKQRFLDGAYKVKQGIEKADTAAGSLLAGKNVNSIRGRLFSTGVGKNGQGVRVGEKVNPDGTISPLFEGSGNIDRRPSLVAPVQNGIKVATPFLAATYVADKLYPEHPNAGADYSDDNGDKTASLLDERTAWKLDKQASLDKIAQLEEQLEKYAEEIQDLRQHEKLLVKQAEDERLGREKVAMELENVRRDFIDKTAESEEFRLRTVARERSKSAVALAEEMVKNGLIKQAALDDTVDKLMDCDDDTFNLFASTAKHASEGEEGLESLAFLSDYSSNGANPASIRPIPGLSRSGQTIGEAAADLINKR